MARGMAHLERHPSQGQAVAVRQVDVLLRRLEVRRRGHEAEEGGELGHRIEGQPGIVGVQVGGYAGSVHDAARTTGVIDMAVGHQEGDRQ